MGRLTRTHDRPRFSVIETPPSWLTIIRLPLVGSTQISWGPRPAASAKGESRMVLPPSAEVPGWDHHDIWVDPTNGSRMIVSHDGGVSITENRGRSWVLVNLPIAQMYHVMVDNRIPYYVYGNRQDGPSTRGPSNNKLGSWGDQPSIPRGQWSPVSGGES